MPKQVDATALRSDIRRAARRVFARRGVEGTGLTHVAREAGMGRSSLYHYYSDKAALLDDLMGEAFEQESALFRACLRAPGSTQKRLDTLIDASVGMLDEWAAVGRMLLDFRIRDTQRFGETLEGLRVELARALREGQRTGEVGAELDPTLVAAVLIGAIDGLLLQHFLDPKALEPEALRFELRRIAARAIAP